MGRGAGAGTFFVIDSGVRCKWIESWRMLGLAHDATVTGNLQATVHFQGRVPTSTGWKNAPSMRRTFSRPTSRISSHSRVVDTA